MRSRERFVLEVVSLAFLGPAQEFGPAAVFGGEFYNYSYSYYWV